MKRVLIGNDLTLANLEGSFTDFQPKSLNPDNINFTFDPSLILTLKKIGFNIFNLANNHSLDFGEKGFTQSQTYLKNNNIDYFGSPLNNNHLSVIKNIRGIKIGFIGYNEFAKSDFNEILEEIKKIKQETDFTVVYAHWGIEYQATFSKIQQGEAHQFIDAEAFWGQTYGSILGS
ncbi:MAG: hypothetical protein COZ95_02025 [Nitrospirae bacterium CG_4_8_14_3_um_filter_50_41]|nr:MAG: hypothetical protein COZ95_02025 [Nitrospirae bacterium CG_4_8_14_3_um_filter_50_41]